MESTRVGFIGLGNMGMLVAKKLVKSGLPLTVYDLRKEPLDEMRALGAAAAGSSREVALASDVIISMVRDIPETDEALFGRDGVWQGAREGATIVISSTVSPAYCRSLHARARQRGVQVIDAAVSTETRDFTPGRESAELTLMIGGEDEAVNRCWPVFQAMAKNVFHLGGVGTGQACKLVNNLAMLGNEMVARECLNLGIMAGLDLAQLIEAMRVSTGSSRSLGTISRRLSQPAPRLTVPEAKAPRQDLRSKDRELALEMAEAVAANVPLARIMAELEEASPYSALSALIGR